MVKSRLQHLVDPPTSQRWQRKLSKRITCCFWEWQLSTDLLHVSWNIWYFPSHFFHFVICYLCLTRETMFPLYDCLPLPLSSLSFSFFAVSSSSSVSHVLEEHHRSLPHSCPFWGLCRVVCRHAICVYLFIPNGMQLTLSCMLCSCCVDVSW